MHMTAQELLDLMEKAIEILEEDNKKRDKEFQEWKKKLKEKDQFTS